MSVSKQLFAAAVAVAMFARGDEPSLADRIANVRLAVEDLSRSFPQAYSRGAEFLKRLDGVRDAEALAAVERDALLANPLIDFDSLLVVRRDPKQMGMPWNWQGNCSLPVRGYNNEIARLSPVRPDGKLTTIYRPPNGEFAGDVKLHFDADKMLFSMPTTNHRWRVWEIDVAGGQPRAIPQIDEPDIDNYDGCYLPDGDLLFTSTAPFNGVPCVQGSDHVANLFRLHRADGNIRQLTFDQDHDWCPTVMHDGRVMYLRWEYSDIPHFVSRRLFSMNPDGTEQRELYGSNSYWPNSTFFAKPVPGSSTKIIGVISGHHDTQRIGELILFDTAQGRREADGVVQRIPGRGKKVEPVIRDGLVKDSWPKFLHPWPLSEKYFIVSAKLTPKSDWGIYLADVFDNMTLIKSLPGEALIEPIPLKKQERPQALPVRVKPDRKDATVHILNIYAGEGLRGVPAGTVKKLRLFTYHFAYHGMGGQVNRVGLDGPWDIKRVIGTVPVEADGSANFKVPANTPISIQPLDGEGKALQLMRSWMTAMPSETVSCVGCHERQNASAPAKPPTALLRATSEINPWYGPTRGFSFVREVQPVLDRHCIGCHDGKPRADGTVLDDFRDAPPVHPDASSAHYNQGTQFTPSYLALKKYVRNPTIESDMHLLMPGEYHADTTSLIQLLKAGHHGVKLDDESMDRIVTWIDLNTPAHGTWHEIVGEQNVDHFRDRRREMYARYAGRDEDPEAITPTTLFANLPPTATPKSDEAKTYCAGDTARSKAMTAAPATLPIQKLDLGDGIAMELVQIPAGEFSMGDEMGKPDEKPVAKVSVGKAFWMGRFEVSNEQFKKFNPSHDSRLEGGDFLQFSERERGISANDTNQPVVRVSWRDAMAFCHWLSAKSGRRVALPTEAQWEYACRAGTTSPLWFGGVDADFSAVANLADASLHFNGTFGWGLPSGAVPSWRPGLTNVNDKFRITTAVGSYAPNPWGLFDMAGNAREWTRSLYRPYPYRDDDGRSDEAADGSRVARGGSWYDRPAWARSASRVAYPPYLGVYDTGFRVVVED